MHFRRLQRSWRVRWVALAVIALVLAACGGDNGGGSAVPTVPPTHAPAAQAQTPTDEASAPPVDAAVPTVPPTDVPTEAVAAPIPGRPDAPAGVDEGFRSDPASVVAATGRPQLLEFFTYW